MKLTIKHLAAYLPYGVKMETNQFMFGWQERRLKLDCGHDFGMLLDLGKVRLYLRPLTGNELTAPIYLNGRIFEPLAELEEMAETDAERQFIEKFMDQPERVIYAPYTIIQQLLEWHFDIFNLIPAGLAIPLTTQPTQPNEKAN